MYVANHVALDKKGQREDHFVQATNRHYDGIALPKARAPVNPE
jgi:hypothetical protein